MVFSEPAPSSESPGYRALYLKLPSIMQILFLYGKAIGSVNSPKINLLIAVALTIVLFVLGGHPSTAGMFSSMGHDAAHVGVFALIAFFYGRGLVRVHWLLIALLVVAIGGLHELSQLTTRAHDAELDDFVLNAAGAFVGAMAFRLSGYLLASRPA